MALPLVYKRVKVIAFLLIIAAFGMTFLCKRLPERKLKEWKSQDQVDFNWKPASKSGRFAGGILLPFGENFPVLSGNNASSIKKYTIKVNFSTRKSGFSPLFGIYFCDQYSWVLGYEKYGSRPGIYRDIGKYKKELISNTKYQDLQDTPKKARYELVLDCDLEQPDVSVYLTADEKASSTAYVHANETFREKVPLLHGGKAPKFYLSLNSDCFIEKMQVFGGKGENYFNADYISHPLLEKIRFNYKMISRAIFLFGIAFLFIFTLFARKISHKLIYCVIILVCLESFLRVTENENPFLDIDLLMRNPQWDIEQVTNLFGKFDNTKEISVSGIPYTVEKTEGATRIICLGTSSTQGHGIACREDRYSGVLERLINSEGSIKCQVINAGRGGWETFRLATYFNDVLVKFSPDIVIAYLGSNDCHYINGIDFRDYYYQFERMKALMRKNKWITDKRMLLMALEFRYPLKWIVVPYNHLCESYLFMWVNNFRKRMLTKMYSKINKNEVYPKSREQISEESLRLIIEACVKRNIKVVLIPELQYPNYYELDSYRKMMGELSRQYNGVHFFDITDILEKNDGLFLFIDSVHPTEIGHSIIAEKIYFKLKQEKLIEGRAI